MDSVSIEKYAPSLVWFPLNRTTQSTAPLLPGIYVMRINESFGRLRGSSDILYIGKTTSSIRQRLAGYLNPGSTQRTNIRINNMLERYPIEIAWFLTDNPSQLETTLLEQYFEEHDEQPPFNYQGPTTSVDHIPGRERTGRRGNRELILEHLQERQPGACDDCLSITLDIKPIQQVNQICNRLTNVGLITRERMRCPRCTVTKIINRTV